MKLIGSLAAHRTSVEQTLVKPRLMLTNRAFHLLSSSVLQTNLEHRRWAGDLQVHPISAHQALTLQDSIAPQRRQILLQIHQEEVKIESSTQKVSVGGLEKLLNALTGVLS